MKLLSTIYRIIPFLVLILVNSSCEKFVNVDPPKNLIITESVFNSNETAIGATLNLYIAMNDSRTVPWYIDTTAGLYVDELTGYSTSDGFKLVYLNSLTPLNNSFFNLWKTGYNIIYQANAIIEGCQQSNQLSESIRTNLIAESQLVRAYWYMLLTSFYGDVPIITSSDYIQNAQISKSPVSDVYKLIIDDLRKAEADLSVDYLAGNTETTTSTNRIRPNKYTATALLARAYLYDKQYAQAELSATKVINYKTLYNLATIDKVFQKSSGEAIWQLAQPTPNATTVNTYEAFYYTLIVKPSTQFANSTTISTNLLNAFEAGDSRKTLWVGKFTDRTVIPNIDYYFPNKYKSKSASIVEENCIVLRLAEQYLIRAEARAMSNNLSEAREDLNTIRNRAGLGDINANDQPSLIDAIIRERRVELFTEWGHRFIDLKRTGKIDMVMNAYATQKGAVWQSFKSNFPIPAREIENNPKLLQNDGYNQ